MLITDAGFRPVNTSGLSQAFADEVSTIWGSAIVADLCAAQRLYGGCQVAGYALGQAYGRRAVRCG